MDDPPEQLSGADFIFEPGEARLFKVEDIVSLHPTTRNGNYYTEVTLASGKKLTVRKAITRILPRLPSCFFPARRGWIINLNHVRDMEHLDRRTLHVTLSDLSEVSISRKQLLSLGRERGL